MYMCAMVCVCVCMCMSVYVYVCVCVCVYVNQSLATNILIGHNNCSHFHRQVRMPESV